MTTENSAAAVVEPSAGLVSFTPEEEAFFSSQGESSIPADVPADAGGAPAPDAAAAKPGADGKPVVEQKPQHVPLAALHEERSKRKTTEKELRETRERLANIEGRFAVLDRLAPKGEAAAAAGDPPAGPPKSTDDVFGAVDDAQTRIAKVEKALQDEAAAKKQSDENTAFVNNYRADADAFQAKTPEYRDAYNFLLSSRAAELISIGYDDPQALQAAGADPADVQAAAKTLHDAIVADEFAIAQMAMSKKKSAAETIYALAKQRGFVKKDAAAPGADGKPAPKPGEQVLDAIERGQAAAKTLNGTGGGPASDDMTAERLIAMPMDQYEAWVAKNPAKARVLMGG